MKIMSDRTLIIIVMIISLGLIKNTVKALNDTTHSGYKKNLEFFQNIFHFYLLRCSK